MLLNLVTEVIVPNYEVSDAGFTTYLTEIEVVALGTLVSIVTEILKVSGMI